MSHSYHGAARRAGNRMVFQGRAGLKLTMEFLRKKKLRAEAEKKNCEFGIVDGEMAETEGQAQDGNFGLQ